MVQKYMSSQVVTLHSIPITGIAQTRVPKICGLEDRSHQYITVDDSVSDSLTFYPLPGGFFKISLMIPVLFPRCEPQLGFLGQLLTRVNFRSQALDLGIAILAKAARGRGAWCRLSLERLKIETSLPG